MTMLIVDLLLLIAAVTSVVAIFAGVLIVGDFQRNPAQQLSAQSRRHGRS